MIHDEMITTKYSHTQHAPLYWILFGSAVFCFVLGGSAYQQPIVPVITGLVGMLMITLGLAFMYLKVEDCGEELSIAFGPLPLFSRTVQYAEIESVEVGKTMFLDGWGIHYSLRGGWVWNIWGFDCVVVKLKSGTLRIGTDDAENLAAFLRQRQQA